MLLLFSSLMELIIVLDLLMHIIGVLHIAREKFAWRARILSHCPIAEAALQPPNDSHLNTLQKQNKKKKIQVVIF